MKIHKIVICDSKFYTVLVMDKQYSSALKKAEDYIRDFKKKKEQNKEYDDLKIMTSEEFMSDVDANQCELEDIIIGYDKSVMEDTEQKESFDGALLGDRRFKSQRDITPPHEYPYHKRKITIKTPEGKKLELERFIKPCQKCEKIEKGVLAKGRHIAECPKANGTKLAKEDKNEPQVKSEVLVEPKKQAIELSGYAADWRSKCCNARLIVQGGDEGTNHYECFKCTNPCDPIMPEPEQTKKFDCEKCGNKFDADVSEDINCPECGSKDIWPTSSV